MEPSIFNYQFLLFAMDSRTFQIFLHSGIFWNIYLKERGELVQLSEKISLHLECDTVFLVEILFNSFRSISTVM